MEVKNDLNVEETLENEKKPTSRFLSKLQGLFKKKPKSPHKDKTAKRKQKQNEEYLEKEEPESVFGLLTDVMITQEKEKIRRFAQDVLSGYDPVSNPIGIEAVKTVIDNTLREAVGTRIKLVQSLIATEESGSSDPLNQQYEAIQALNGIVTGELQAEKRAWTEYLEAKSRYENVLNHSKNQKKDEQETIDHSAEEPQNEAQTAPEDPADL